MTDTQGKSLLQAFDYVWERLITRVAGLDDAEYFWEPVDGCWSLRDDGSGKLVLDGGGGGGPPPDPVPVTTIAWRIGHICDLVLVGFARRVSGAADSEEAPAQPGEAAALADYMAQCYALWHDSLASVPDEQWVVALGPAFGPYAESNWFDLVLHVLDELVHHAAEVALMRDLYANRASLGERAAG